MNQFTKQLYNMIDNDNRPTIIDYVYDGLDDFLLVGRFDQVDQIFAEIDIVRLSPPLLLAMLIISKPWDGELKTRYSLGLDIKKYFIAMIGQERSDKLLNGLVD